MTYQGYVAGFMFNNNRDKVLLIEKQKPAWQKNLYNGIGGKLEKTELPIQAMVREFKEETGVDTEEYEWELFCTINGSFGEVCFYSCFSDKLFDADSAEEEKVMYWDVKQLWGYVPVISNLRWLIPLALDTNNIDYSIEAGV